MNESISAPIINLDELSVTHERTEENRLRIFEDILKSCHNKIKKYNNEFKRQECLFVPPVFIFGKPPYNYMDLLTYLITSLKNNGLKIEWLKDKQSLYISWKKIDIDINKYHTQFAKLIYRDTPSTNVHPLSMIAVPSIRSSAKKKKKITQPTLQHVAMLEYHPGARDYVPVNISGIS
jgi:hypothetical protein